jgi:uncharacterized membrane protein YsdA (DUF1294 family)
MLMAAVIGTYVAMSVLALALYAIDKGRARRNAWRISEATLHGVELLGGWPGAWIAQRVFRHKVQKGSYAAVFWTIVALHVAGWGWWLAR